LHKRLVVEVWSVWLSGCATPQSVEKKPVRKLQNYFRNCGIRPSINLMKRVQRKNFITKTNKKINKTLDFCAEESTEKKAASVS